LNMKGWRKLSNGP